jgi:hypothetical protein
MAFGKEEKQKSCESKLFANSHDNGGAIISLI